MLDVRMSTRWGGVKLFQWVVINFVRDVLATNNANDEDE